MAEKSTQYSVTTKRANGTTLVVRGSLSVGKATVTGHGKGGSVFTLTDSQVATLTAHGYKVGAPSEAQKAEGPSAPAAPAAGSASGGSGS